MCVPSVRFHAFPSSKACFQFTGRLLQYLCRPPPFKNTTIFSFLFARHPSLFFLLQTRHTCASALCKVALRLPDPVRFDAYCFLKGLADAADVFPLVAPRGGTETVPETGADGGSDSLLLGYRREQEALSARMEAGTRFFLKVVGNTVVPRSS